MCGGGAMGVLEVVEKSLVCLCSLAMCGGRRGLGDCDLTDGGGLDDSAGRIGDCRQF